MTEPKSETSPMTTAAPGATAVSLRDLAFVRDVLIPRVAWLRGDEIDELLRLRMRLDQVFVAFSKASEAVEPEPPKRAP